MNTGSPACPGCASPLGPPPVTRCPQCRLPLLGQDAAALWQVTLALAGLDAQRHSLLLHRDHLLAGLRARQDLPDPPPHPPYRPPLPPRQEVSGPSAQTVLLALGGLLVAVAALVFTVVSWGRLGLGAKALILTGITLGALLAPLPLRRRALTATAETSAALGLSLVLLDWYAARAVGLGGPDRLGAAAYWAGATALTAAGATAYGRALRLRGPLPVALLLLQLPFPLAAVAIGGGPAAIATACLLTALVDLALATRTTAPALTVTATGWALLGGGSAAGRVADATTLAEARPHWLPLALLVALGLGAALLPAGVLPAPLRAAGPRCASAALAGIALLAGLGGSLRFAFSTDWGPAAYAVPGALLALAGVSALTVPQPRHPAAWRGLLGSAAAALLLTGLGCLPALLTAFFAPTAQWGGTWFGADATLPAWQLAPAPTVLPWLLVAVLAAAAARCARTGHRPWARPLGCSALAVGIPVVLLLPTLLHLPLRAGAGWAVLLTVGATAALLRRPTAPAAALVLLAPTALAAVLWSGTDRPTTIAVWSVLAVLAALSAVALPAPWTPGPAVAAVLLLAVVAVTTGATAGLAPHEYAFAVLAVTALSVPVAARTDRPAGLPAELTGYALVPVAAALTAGHPAALSLLLAVAGLLALGVAALRPERRRRAGAGATALLVLSSWVRLVIAGVTAPEPYTISVAAAALTIGHLHRRRTPSAPSWTTYGPGLGTALLPSLLAVWADPHWLRPLLLGGCALALTVFGARRLLQAPLVLGAGTLLLVAGHELAPLLVEFLDVLPRWLPLAAAGLLLLVLGATYEQRLRDARRARDGLRRMA
ncbi:SCO7613 C-terminal domain-containing membrane protein [Kitasatospora sp. NPDC101801]|uniref:SCO7613 C-terminal domain-containing membrane protein n=1 Tax=Kitasatospora sp. NPDC101801 TaxID=3364103 RepID=UPI0038276E3E